MSITVDGKNATTEQLAELQTQMNALGLTAVALDGDAKIQVDSLQDWQNDDGSLSTRRDGKITGNGDETGKMADLIARAESSGRPIDVNIPTDNHIHTFGELSIPDKMILRGACPPPREAFTRAMVGGYSSIAAPAGAAYSLAYGNEVKISNLVFYGADAETGANGKTRDGFIASPENPSGDINRAWIIDCGFFMMRDGIGRSDRSGTGTNAPQYVRTPTIRGVRVSNCKRGINNLIDTDVDGLVQACDEYGTNQEAGANNATFLPSFTCSDMTKIINNNLNRATSMRFSGGVRNSIIGSILDSASGDAISVLSGAGLQVVGAKIRRSGTGDMHQKGEALDIRASGFSYLHLSGVRTEFGTPDNATAFRRLPFTGFTGTPPTAGMIVTSPGGKSGKVVSFDVTGGTGSVILSELVGTFASGNVLTFTNSSTATASGADAPPSTPNQSVNVNGIGSGRFEAISNFLTPRGGTGNRIVIQNPGNFGQGYRLIGNYDVADV